MGTGTVDMQVVPPNCSRLLRRPHDPDEGMIPWLRKAANATEGVPCAPFFHMRLRPGDGVVLPSGTFHRVVSREDRRVSLNAFFEPAFGEMRWKSAPSNFYVRQHVDVLATRALWIKVVRHLWETR